MHFSISGSLVTLSEVLALAGIGWWVFLPPRRQDHARLLHVSTCVIVASYFMLLGSILEWIGLGYDRILGALALLIGGVSFTLATSLAHYDPFVGPTSSSLPTERK